MATEQTDNLEPLVATRQDVKRLLKVSARSVDRLCERQALRPFYLPGSRLPRFRMSSVLELLDECERRAGKLNPGAAPENRPVYLGDFAGCAA